MRITLRWASVTKRVLYRKDPMKLRRQGNTLQSSVRPRTMAGAQRRPRSSRPNIPAKKILLWSVREEPLKKVMPGFKHTGKSYIYRTDNQQDSTILIHNKNNTMQISCSRSRAPPDSLFPYDSLTYLWCEYSPEPVIFAKAGRSTAFLIFSETVIVHENYHGGYKCAPRS
jgi:hypothetical protein